METTIYKYFRVNEFLFDTLISNELYFSSISQFNDPYDCYFTGISKIPVEDFKVFLKNSNISQDLHNKYLHALQSHPQELSKQLSKLFINQLNYIGICCFSKVKNNLLMWSHYAESHKGVVLGFDFDILKRMWHQFEDVNYQNEPYLFDIKDINSSLDNTVLRKSTDWEYEKEVRFIMERTKNVAFNKNALTEINFGTGCSKRNIMNLHFLISQIGYGNCKFNTSVLNINDYKIEFEKLDVEKLRSDIMEQNKKRPFKGSINLEHILND